MIYGINMMILIDIGEEIGKIGANLIPHLFPFIVQLCSLVVLIIIVMFVAYKPLKKMLKKRADYIENNISDSEKDKAIAKQNLEQSRETILSSKKEASSIIDRANQEATKQRESIIQETKLDVIRLQNEAEMDIQKSKEKSLENIRREMISVALAASQEILQREVNEKDNAKLAEDFIEKLN